MSLLFSSHLFFILSILLTLAAVYVIGNKIVDTTTNKNLLLIGLFLPLLAELFVRIKFPGYYVFSQEAEYREMYPSIFYGVEIIEYSFLIASIICVAYIIWKRPFLETNDKYKGIIIFGLISLVLGVSSALTYTIYRLFRTDYRILNQVKALQELNPEKLDFGKNKPFRYEVDVWLYFVNGITCYFIILLSLGIAGPWAICKWGRFHASKSSINGKNLVFTGNAKEFLPTYLILILLMIVTAGIYGIWAGPKVMKWYWESFDFKE